MRISRISGAVLAVCVALAGCGDVRGALSPTEPRLSVLSSVVINGPTQVKPNELCSWNANVTGGTPPFSYVWSQSAGSGTNNGDGSYEGSSGNSFTLSVTVTDALGASVGDTHSVSVSSHHFYCP